MRFDEFERRAWEVFRSIPAEFREGIDGLDVARDTVPHPSLPDIYTLGECLTDEYPGEFGGPGEVRSVVRIYYGSFVALSRLDPDWDWEEEIYVTVTHEVQHHRESLALDQSLEELDYAEDQNFARREGRPFDPFFYQRGTPVGPAAWEVDGDLFIEVPVGAREVAAGAVTVRWDDRDHTIPLTPPLPDLHFVRLATHDDPPSDLFAVLHRRRGPLEWLAALFRPRPLEVREE